MSLTQEYSTYGADGIGFYSREEEKLITGADKIIDDYGSLIKQEDAQATSVAFLPAGSEKIVKALNHLRKLCGGPESLEF